MPEYEFNGKKWTQGEMMVGDVIDLVDALDFDNSASFRSAESAVKSLARMGPKVLKVFIRDEDGEHPGEEDVKATMPFDVAVVIVRDFLRLSPNCLSIIERAYQKLMEVGMAALKKTTEPAVAPE